MPVVPAACVVGDAACVLLLSKFRSAARARRRGSGRASARACRSTFLLERGVEGLRLLDLSAPASSSVHARRVQHVAVRVGDGHVVGRSCSGCSTRRGARSRCTVSLESVAARRSARARPRVGLSSVAPTNTWSGGIVRFTVAAATPSIDSIVLLELALQRALVVDVARELVGGDALLVEQREASRRPTGCPSALSVDARLVDVVGAARGSSRRRR